MHHFWHVCTNKNLQTYMAPGISIFGDFTKDASAMYNNFRVYGTALLVVMGTIVFIGVKFVNKFATVALACVLLSILAVYVGVFVNFNGNDKLRLVLFPACWLHAVTNCETIPNLRFYGNRKWYSIVNLAHQSQILMIVADSFFRQQTA